MPEIGFDEEPISPVSRDDTVTKRKPNRTISSEATRLTPRLANVTEPPVCQSNTRNAQMPNTSTSEPNSTKRIDISRSVRRVVSAAAPTDDRMSLSPA